MLHVLVVTLLLLAWAPLALAVTYLLMLTAAAALPAKLLPAARSERRFRIIIPAHDEALVLEPVLHRLKAVHYPQQKYEIVVVADNCSDATANIARACGVRVIERFDPQNRGKGHALAYAFARLRGEQFDAYVVLDADTLVDAGLLAVMNKYLEAGYTVLQAHYDVLNPWESRRTALMYIALRIFNYVRPLGRRNLGLSTGLQGNGMCFAKGVIDRYAWNAFSLAEDIEYTTTLVLNGKRVVFAPEAVVAAQMPAARPQATSQRLRWEGGRLQIARRDGLRLIARGLQRFDWQMFDWGIDLLIPPLAALVLATFAGLSAALLSMWLGVLASPVLALAWVALVGGLALFVIAALAVGGVSWQGYVALLNAPRYLIWKSWLYVQMLARRTPRSWVRTDRSRILDR